MPNGPMADSPALLSADRLDELVKLVQLVKLKNMIKTNLSVYVMTRCRQIFKKCKRCTFSSETKVEYSEAAALPPVHLAELR